MKSLHFTQSYCYKFVICSLNGTEDTVTSVTEAWKDVANVIKASVKLGGVDCDLRVLIVDDLDTLWCGYEAENLDVLNTLLLQNLDGSKDGTTSSKHWVGDDTYFFFKLGWEMLIVYVRFKSFVVAVHTEMANAGIGDEIVDTFSHAKTSSENWHDADFALIDTLGGHFFKWGSDLDIGRWEVSGELISHKHCDFIEQVFEIFT